MKKYYEKLDRLREQAEKVEPTYNRILKLFQADENEMFSIPENDHLCHINYYPEWSRATISIAAWYTTEEEVAERILSKLKTVFPDLYFKKSDNGEVLKLLYTASLGEIDITVQLIEPRGCEWKKVITETYTYDCGGAE